jgi:hypothetical protein
MGKPLLTTLAPTDVDELCAMKSTRAWQQSSRTHSGTGWGSPTTRKRLNFLQGSVKPDKGA